MKLVRFAFPVLFELLDLGVLLELVQHVLLALLFALVQHIVQL